MSLFVKFIVGTLAEHLILRQTLNASQWHLYGAMYCALVAHDTE